MAVAVGTRSVRFAVDEGSVAVTRSNPAATLGRGQAAVVTEDHALALSTDPALPTGGEPPAGPQAAAPDAQATDRNGGRPVAEVLARAARGELALLRQMPPDLVARLRGEVPNAEGFVASNRDGFNCSGDQRYALMAMVAGVALRRADLIDDAWGAAEAVLPFQAPHGGFLDPLSCDVLWLGHVSHGLVLLRESEDAEAYAERTRKVLPRIAKLAGWLAQPATVSNLYAISEKNQVTYFSAAIAFGLSGLLLDDVHLQALGRDFMDRGLRHQRPDGSFTIVKGIDTGSQSSILWRIAMYLIRFPEPRYAEALRSGVQWQLGRITAKGEVNVADSATRIWIASCRKQPLSSCLTFSFDVLAWSLLYYGGLADPHAVAVAADVLKTRRLVVLPAAAQ